MLDATLDTTDQHGAFRRVLAERDIRSALALLNRRASYRFTAIYKLAGPVLRAQHAFDRDSEYRTWLMAVPLERSFCQYAIERGEFMTAHVSAHDRLERPHGRHPGRDSQPQAQTPCGCQRRPPGPRRALR